MSAEYWAERQAAAQAILTEKNAKQIDAEIARYYRTANTKIIGQFEKVYNKVILSKQEGIEPTPADLYKLDSYWKMLAQTQKELQKLGDTITTKMTQSFIRHFQQIYEVTALETNLSFGTIDKSAVEQIINQIWCSDGKSWSSRVWNNIANLQNTLTDGLLECLVTGKQPNELKRELQKRFNVSFSNADMIVRTEMAHIQTQAAQKRYQDSGIEWVEVLADKDERRCEVCGKLHRKRFPANGQMPVPAHPRCRCCIIPVIDEYHEQLKLDGF
jgi:SPP1 gp7 family putative phage head morphogenesis protein